MENCTHSKIAGIFGTARSGSSWLGSIISSHPQVAYRFEPFHRLKKHHSLLEQASKLLESEQLNDTDLSQVYQILLPAHPKLERPPFFSNDYSWTLGKAWLRPLALQFKIIGSWFEKLYRARGEVTPLVVFKEVNLERMMINLLQHTSIPIIYLVRHPGGVVASMLRGKNKGIMRLGRESILAKVLVAHDPQLADQWLPKIAQMDDFEQRALFWRIDVEKAISAVRAHPKTAKVVIYEDLCDRPHEVVAQIFQHFGLELPRQTVAFLDRLTTHNLPSRWRELGVNYYYSVLKNPALTKNRWKQELPLETQQRIFKVVQESVAFQFCAAFGKWD